MNTWPGSIGSTSFGQGGLELDIVVGQKERSFQICINAVGRSQLVNGFHELVLLLCLLFVAAPRIHIAQRNHVLG